MSSITRTNTQNAYHMASMHDEMERVHKSGRDDRRGADGKHGQRGTENKHGTHGAHGHHGAHGSRHAGSSHTSSVSSPTSTYVYNPSMSSKPNDPIVQGYHLTIPVDQYEPTGKPQTGSFTWEAPSSGTSLWGTSSPSIDDVNQGQLGDCYFDAAVGALANSPSGAAALHDAVTPSKIPGIYDVHFYAKNSHGDTRRVTIPVNASELTDASGMPVGNKVGANQALYPQILEKAYAIYCNKYPDNTVQSGHASGASGSTGTQGYNYGALDDHGQQGSGDTTIKGALFALTGQTSKNTHVSESTPTSAITDLLSQAGTSDIIANTKSSDKAAGLAAPHVYDVLGYDPSTGMVKLRDPHGVNNSHQHDADGHGTFEITLAQFQKHFAAITQLPQTNGSPEP